MCIDMYTCSYTHALIDMRYIHASNIAPSLRKHRDWVSSHLYLPIKKLTSILSQPCRFL